MKRVALILVAIWGLLSVAAYAQEIQFRDMDWLIDEQQFETALDLSGVVWEHDISRLYSGYQIDTWRSFDGLEPSWTYNNVPRISRWYESKDGEYICSAGGYMVSAINAEFLPQYYTDTNIIINSGGDKCNLVRASYQMYGVKENGERPGVDSCYKDMVNKLTALYGQPIGVKKGYSVGNETTYWVKPDWSALSVSKTDAGLTGWVMVEYALTSEQSFVEKLDNIVMAAQEEARQKDMNNTDGL